MKVDKTQQWKRVKAKVKSSSNLGLHFSFPFYPIHAYWKSSFISLPFISNETVTDSRVLHILIIFSRDYFQGRSTYDS